MTRIVWDGYIADQMQWADRLGKLAAEAEAREATGFRHAANRALENAVTALRLAATGDSGRFVPPTRRRNHSTD